MKPTTYHSNGKLLLSGEYVVLDGALSLAIPTRYGQSLKVEPIEESKIIWKSLDEKGLVWFETSLLLEDIVIGIKTSNNEITNRLIHIFSSVKELNPLFLSDSNGFKVTTSLTFPRNWGLGTSSTLINNMAQWGKVDAYALLEKTFGGSGYDIACAQRSVPITYQLENGNPIVNEVNFNPNFSEHLYFIYLNKKQNSREGIAHYKANRGKSSQTIAKISDLTNRMINCSNLEDFESVLVEHEKIISTITQQKTVKELLFHDFNGTIKSLGAWGGDFILATSQTNPTNYFKSKGFNTIIPYKDMVFNN